MNSRVEDLVPAVLGIRLREHHQLDIGGIAPERAEGLDQIIDLIARQRETPVAHWRARAPHGHLAPSITTRSGRGARGAKQIRRDLRLEPERFGHAIVQQRAERAQLRLRRAAAAASMKYSVPRSMRRTTSSPHTWAISVALLDHGETVPDPRRHQHALAALRLQMRAGARRSATCRAVRARIRPADALRRRNESGARRARGRAVLAPAATAAVYRAGIATARARRAN